MKVNKHFIIEFMITHQDGIYIYHPDWGQELLTKEIGSRKNLPLFCHMDVVLNCFVMTYCYTHRLAHLSIFIKDSPSCNRLIINTY